MKGPHVSVGATAPSLYTINPYNNTMVIVTIACLIHVSHNCLLLYTENRARFIWHEKFIIQFKTKKNIGHHTRF